MARHVRIPHRGADKHQLVQPFREAGGHLGCQHGPHGVADVVAPVDVQDLASVVQGVGVVGDVEVALGLIGFAVSKHVKRVAGVMLAEGVDYGMPCPGRRTKGMKHHQRVAAALLHEVHVAFRCRHFVGEVSSDEHIPSCFPPIFVGRCVIRTRKSKGSPLSYSLGMGVSIWAAGGAIAALMPRQRSALG